MRVWATRALGRWSAGEQAHRSCFLTKKGHAGDSRGEPVSRKCCSSHDPGAIHSCGRYGYGLCSYDMCRYGLCSCGRYDLILYGSCLYCYGLYGYMACIVMACIVSTCIVMGYTMMYLESSGLRMIPVCIVLRHLDASLYVDTCVGTHARRHAAWTAVQ